METNEQIVKTREDAGPVRMEYDTNSSDEDKGFKLSPNAKCSWAESDKHFGWDKLRPRIEPWLNALTQSEHLSLLVGSGLTHAVHEIATDSTVEVMSPNEFDNFDNEILAEVKRIAQSTQRGGGNLEDQIRIANELLRGLEILASGEKYRDFGNKYANTLRQNLTMALGAFATSILEAERNLVTSCACKRENAFNYLVSFLMSFAHRSSTQERLHIFTTNYDRCIEVGADVAGLRLMDRFVGTLAPVFRASRLNIDLHYNPPGIRGEPRYLDGVARFTKLHGSIDWADYGGAIRRIGLPFGATDVKPFLAASGGADIDARQLMIYPNAAKDRETTYYPYVELFRDLAAAICRPNSTLICYGYSFGDEHINRVIEDMLTIPSSHLVIISYDDPLDRIVTTYNRLGRHSQVTLLMGNQLGDLRTLVDRCLPMSSIDRTNSRMAELLKMRFNIIQGETGQGQESPPNDDTGTHETGPV